MENPLDIDHGTVEKLLKRKRGVKWVKEKTDPSKIAAWDR